MSASPTVAPDGSPDLATTSWVALAVLLTANFLAVLSSTIVTVAVPDIRASLHIGPAGTVWVLGAYALAYGVALIPGGRWGDAVGRRRVFLGGMVAFTAAAVLAALAPTASVLVLATAAQGLGAGLMVPQVLATIATALPPAAQARGFGLYGLATGLGAAAGPVLGGVLLAVDPWHLGWRSVFGVVALCAVVATTAAVAVVPQTRGRGGRPDVVGTVLLAAALVAVLVPVTAAQQGGFDVTSGGVIILGLLGLGGFACWQRHRRDQGRVPLIHPALFGVRSFTGAILVGLLYFAAFQGLLVTTAIALQSSGSTALEAGAVLTPLAVAAVVSSLVSHRMSELLGSRVLVLGAGLVVLGLALALLVAGGGSPWMLAVVLAVAGLGHGLIVPPNIGLGLRDVPTDTAGGAGGAINTAQRVGQSIGISVLGGLFLATAATDGAGHAFRGSLVVELLTVVAMAGAALLVPRRPRTRTRTRPDEVTSPR